MTNPLTQHENTILEALRELKPYESIEITKDRNGKPDTFLIHRHQKITLAYIKETKKTFNPHEKQY